MVDYNALKKKFRPKDPGADSRRRASKAAVKRIAREYEQKRITEGIHEPAFRRTPLYYGFLILLMVLLAGAFIAAMTGKAPLGKKRIERADLQARKSMNALSVALGRYRFHVGDWPSTEEGLGALAAKASRKKGWDGPYVNHIVNDPWGHAYVYETRPEGGHPVLYSKGPDGRAGTTDDVLPDQDSFDAPFRDTTWTNGWAPYRLRGIVVAPDEETKRRVEAEMKAYDPKPNP